MLSSRHVFIFITSKCVNLSEKPDISVDISFTRVIYSLPPGIVRGEGNTPSDCLDYVQLQLAYYSYNNSESLL